MATDQDRLVPADAPQEIQQRVLEEPRAPVFNADLGLEVDRRIAGEPPHRLVVIGDSLSQGFQSGAVFNTDLSYPAIIAYELGWFEGYRFPRYMGRGGLPLNIEFVLRDLESRFGSEVSAWELPFALFRARDFLDGNEDYWERGAGRIVPSLTTTVHALANYGWDLRDALDKTATTCEAALRVPKDDFLNQIIENSSERAALRVYPRWSPAAWTWTVFDAAEELGRQHGDETEAGIETLLIQLGANNALGAVTELRLTWSGDQFQDIWGKGAYTVWSPTHFTQELGAVVERVKAIAARHVVWCTVPHVTIPPVTRGLGAKMRPGSRYFPYYTRPWVDEAHFDAGLDKHLTGEQARAVDCAIDMYNDAIQRVVEDARRGTDGTVRDWLLFDLSGVLDRLASRRFISDPNARPGWWTPYPLPPLLSALQPPPDSRFLTSDGHGGRATGGLFSLDGVHPTTIGHGLIAQELISIMRSIGVEFRQPNLATRADPVTVDFERLIRRDTLLRNPPQNLTSALDILGWADDTLDLFRRALQFRV
jgi:hypothetical protein